MKNLFQNKERIFNLINRVKTKDPFYCEHILLLGDSVGSLTTPDISIVMTASNRSLQTYYTISSIFSQTNTNNIHIVLVDDSTDDPIDPEKLRIYTQGTIDFIRIRRENKDWHNPLVNYNIGFQYVRGKHVIIQNAEVFHIGNVCDFVTKNVTDNRYYVFDVLASMNYEINNEIYGVPPQTITTNEIYKKYEINDNIVTWYQNENNPRNLHFLTAMTRKTFELIGGFSYDCAFGSWYDDNDFLIKIISKRIEIVNIFHNIYLMGGFHLFHGKSAETWDKNVEMNELTVHCKSILFNETGIYIDLTDNMETFDYKKNKITRFINGGGYHP